ncbi:MAG: ribokinase, partial [Lachnospiraceae bacterium]|nr:ribokinase [Lachnospiraceae bacterium]
KVFHFAGLIKGDFEDEMIRVLSERAKVALDVQGILRDADLETGSMDYHDWDAKKTYLPYVTYLKTDAAEAEILTGLTDRKEAAKQMAEWGAKEIMITHHDEVLVYDGKDFYTCPLKPRSLAGRTGRGDTTFSAYITERQRAGIQEALNFAAQLVSLKMETPGPFKGSREDVAAFAESFA